MWPNRVYPERARSIRINRRSRVPRIVDDGCGIRPIEGGLGLGLALIACDELQVAKRPSGGTCGCDSAPSDGAWKRQSALWVGVPARRPWFSDAPHHSPSLAPTTVSPARISGRDVSLLGFGEQVGSRRDAVEHFELEAQLADERIVRRELLEHFQAQVVMLESCVYSGTFVWSTFSPRAARLRISRTLATLSAAYSSSQLASPPPAR